MPKVVDIAAVAAGIESKRRGRPRLQDPPSVLALVQNHREDLQQAPSLDLDPSRQESGIGPQDLMVPSVDAQGHSSPVNVRVPPIMHYQIKRIVEAGKLPWRTHADLVRWCIAEGLTKIAHLVHDQQLSDANAQMRAMQQLYGTEQTYLEFSNLMQHVEEHARRLEQGGFGPRARKLLLTLYGQLLRIQDDEWRTDFKREFKRRFRKLVPELFVKEQLKPKRKSPRSRS